MTSEEDTNQKERRRNPATTRQIIIAVTCLIGLAMILFSSPSESMSSLEKSNSVRTSTQSQSASSTKKETSDALKEVIKTAVAETIAANPPTKKTTKTETTVEKEKISEKETDSAKEEDDEEDRRESLKVAQSSLRDAKWDIEEAEAQAVTKSEEALQDTLQGVEKSIKEALDQLLMKRRGYSSDQVKEIEEEVVKKLENEVHDRLENEAALIAEDAEQDMDTVFENDVLAKVDSKGIETDVNAMREYFVEEAQREVDFVAKHIKENIRDIAEEVEKEVISEKLSVDTSSSDLEDAELQVKVTGVMDEINDNEKKEISKMELDVTKDVKEMNTNVKEALRPFLEKKGLSASQIEKIQLDVSKRLEKEANKQVKEKEDAVQQEVNQAMHIELDGLIEEDKFIIDRAKQLGLSSPKTGYSTKSKDVDLIEKDITEVKESFDDYMKDITSQITKDLQHSIQEVVAKIEADVLKEKGVTVSKDEMDELLEKEKINVRRRN